MLEVNLHVYTKDSERLGASARGEQPIFSAKEMQRVHTDMSNWSPINTFKSSELFKAEKLYEKL